MKTILYSLIIMILFSACAQKEFDQRSYDRQNKAADKSLNSI